MWIQLLGVVYNLNHVISFELKLSQREIVFIYAYPNSELIHGHSQCIYYPNHMDDDYIKSDYRRLLDATNPGIPLKQQYFIL